MEPFFPLDEATLEWRSAGGMGRKYQLLSRRGVIAEAAIANTMRRKVDLAISTGHWHLEGTGRRIEVAAGPVLAAKDPTGTKWVLDHPSLRLESTNPWGTDWQWMDAAGNGLIGFRQKGLARIGFQVFLDDSTWEQPNTPLLLGLGFCLLMEKAAASA